MSGNDTTILRSSASPKRTSSKEMSANAHVQLSNALPVVNVTMGNGRPQQKNSMQKGNVVVWGGQGGNKRPPSNVQILDKKGAGSSVVVMPKAAPTFSNGALLLFQTLVTGYIAEQSEEGGDLTAADLARGILSEVEAALNPAAVKASPAMIAHQVGQSSGARPGAAPRGVQRASTGTLPMVNVDLRNAAPVVEVKGAPTSPNGKPVIQIDMDDQDR